MTAIHTALTEAPKADVVNYALRKSDECHDLRRANADLKRRLRAMAVAGTRRECLRRRADERVWEVGSGGRLADRACGIGPLVPGIRGKHLPS